jgi:hypothetical protein
VFSPVFSGVSSIYPRMARARHHELSIVERAKRCVWRDVEKNSRELRKFPRNPCSNEVEKTFDHECPSVSTRATSATSRPFSADYLRVDSGVTLSLESLPERFATRCSGILARTSSHIKGD